MEPSFQEFENACESGDLETVERALAVFSTETVMLYNNRAFHTAARSGQLNVVNRLLEIAEVRSDATRALTCAVKNGHLAVVNRLLEIPEVLKFARDSSGGEDSLLAFAARYGHLDVVNRLLEIPEVLYGADGWDNDALFSASEHGHVDVANRFLEIPAIRDGGVLASHLNSRGDDLENRSLGNKQNFIKKQKDFFKEIEDRRFTRIVVARCLFEKTLDQERASMIDLAPDEEDAVHCPAIERQILTYLYHDVLCGKTACFEREEKDSFFKCPVITRFRKDALGAKARAQAKVEPQVTTSTSTNSSTEHSKKALTN